MIEKQKKSAYKIIAVCSLVYFVSYFSRKDFAAVLAGMLSEGVLLKTQGGFIGTATFICYGIGQLISGYLGDKLKPYILLSLGIALTAICNLIMPFLSPSIMIIVWGVNGFAQAMLWPPIVRLLAEALSGEAFVKGNLIVTTSAHISTIILYLYVPVCLKYFSWQTVFFSASILSFVALVVFILSMTLVIKSDHETPTKQSKNPENTQKQGFWALVTGSGLITIFLAIITMGYLRDGIESWLPTLYAEAFNREASESVLVSAILPIFSILSIIVITALHKTRLFNNEIKGSIVLFFLSAIICVPMALLMNSNSPIARFICLLICALICACMHACNFLLISCIPGRFARFGKAATTSGVCNACTYIGAAISTYGMAAIAENLGWTINVIVWLIIALLGVIFSLLSLKKYTQFTI